MDIKEFIDGDQFEAIADLNFGDKCKGNDKPINRKVIINFINSFKEKRFPIIYCDSFRVKHLLNVLNDDDPPFILVSHNSDAILYEENIINKPKCVKKWYTQNLNIKNNSNVKAIPIGLERKFWSKNKYGKMGHKHNKIHAYAQLNDNSLTNLLYLNFNIQTNKNKRSHLIPFFEKKEWAHIRIGGPRGNFDHYLQDILKSHYILCPTGNGIDCHRQWEILYMNRIPIIEWSYNAEEIYGDLPVFIIDDFKNLTKDRLLENLKILKNKKNNMDKLKFSYWKNLILNGK